MIGFILWEALFMGSLYAWQVLGIEGAGNLFQFLAWGVSALELSILALHILTDEECRPKKRKEISALRKLYNRTRNAVVVLVLAWAGFPVLATMYALASVAVICLPDQKGGAQ